VSSDRAPGIAVHRSGSGPDVVLFHGGMGSWKHWARNIEPLAARFTVHAHDLHRIPRAGHWSAYENASEVNRLMLEFFSS
jgi:pimeloyl-ACP methyl ester carboxylesterase